MISTTDFKKGLRFEHEDAPWQVMEFTVQNPSARGAATLVKVKSRNLVTGQVLLKTFKSGEMFEEPDLEKFKVQFLYPEGENLIFMDNDSYEQHAVPASKLGDAAVWLSDGLSLSLLQYNGEIIQIEMPDSVLAEVSNVEAGAKGDTASGKTYSKAELTNGVAIMVPTYIKEGTKVRVNPNTNEYLGRE